MRTPDRWDREVKEWQGKHGGLWSDNVAELLRRQHQWVEAMVIGEWFTSKALAVKTDQSGDPRDHIIAERLRARATQCHEILAKLKERAQ